MLKDAVHKLVAQKDLTEAEMIGAMNEIMEGEAQEALVASFLTALAIKGETIAEITGGAKVMRAKAQRVEFQELYTIDTCGTGGDGSGTYNISTAVAFVAAAAGAPVAKHGNRSVSSKSGSADVLEALGVNLSLGAEAVQKGVEEVKIGFLFAPMFHTAMKHAIGVRKSLGFRTVFNILGPLTNPAFAKAQILGVFDEKLTEPMAQVLRNLGVERALVVHGMDGLDELTVTDQTKITELYQGEMQTYYISPEEFGISRCSLRDIMGGDAFENADIIRQLLRGKKGPKREILLLNSGAALYVAGKVKTIAQGIERAAELIDTGAVQEKLEAYIAYTQKVGRQSA